jgi:hypothetical protein
MVLSIVKSQTDTCSHYHYTWFDGAHHEAGKLIAGSQELRLIFNLDR